MTRLSGPTPDEEATVPRERTIGRAELVAIVDAASKGCTGSTRIKLHAVAESTEAVAVGWFHCDGVTCPAQQAGRKNQRFQEAFDRLMAESYEVALDDSGEVPPFVVRVTAR